MTKTKTKIPPRLLIAALVLAGWALQAGSQLVQSLWKLSLPRSAGAVEATAVNTRAGTVKACRRAKLAPLRADRLSNYG